MTQSSELRYHFTLWSIYYKESVKLLVQLDELGNLTTYKLHDLIDRFYGVETDAQVCAETGQFLPGATDDVDLAGYIDSQFMWGKAQYTFYRHPSDDFRCLVSTKNIMGR